MPLLAQLAAPGAPLDQAGGMLPDGGDWLAKIEAWFKEHAVAIIGVVLLVVIAVILWGVLRETRAKRALQRDGLERYRRAGASAGKRNRSRNVKTVETTGNEDVPDARIGRYVGHVWNPETLLVVYRPGLIAKARLLHVMPGMLDGEMDTTVLRLRAIGVYTVEDMEFARPDYTDPEMRARWARVGVVADTEREFSERVKAYYDRAVDNGIMDMAGKRMSEDREFVIRETTRGDRERAETEEVAVPQGAAQAPAVEPEGGKAVA